MSAVLKAVSYTHLDVYKRQGVGVLYSKIARDSIIMFCLEKKHSILKCEELLEKYKELSIINEK